MTVIEVSVNRQRPGLVRKDLDSSPGVVREVPGRRRKSPENALMQPIQGCVFGDFLAGDSREIPPITEKDHSPEPTTDRLFRIEGDVMNVPNLCSKRQKITSRLDLPQVRGRRKSRWKLKFHHQALPPEYLRHYKLQERKRRQSESKKSAIYKSKIRKLVRKTVNSVDSRNSVDPLSVEVMEKNDTDGKEEEQPERLKSPGIESSKLEESKENEEDRKEPGKELLSSNISNISQLNIDISQNKAFLENLLTNQIEINRVENKEKKVGELKAPSQQRKPEDKSKPQPIPTSGKIMNFSDLPYMGEITLDGIKPRRGRKPKKADICHLIYKNYGQIFPGSPGRSPDNAPSFKNKVKWKSDISNGWNQMNSSQSTKVSDRRMVESPLPSVSGLINHTEVQNRIINSLLEKRLTQEKRSNCDGRQLNDGNREEPLNLCIRDLQSLKIKLSRKHGNIYETKNLETDGKKDGAGIKKEVIQIDYSDSEKGYNSEEEDEEDDLAPFNLVTTELRESSDEDNFLNFNDQITLTKVKTGEEKSDPRLNPSDPYWPGSILPSLYYQKHNKIKESRKPKPDVGKRVSGKLSPNAAHVITKRKRSAIFIPPVPAENTTNPTTEVSICKFKFTGGAKPSLQEKKMLSVDSGGNFRYYSGTGDKSMRGYEYFPRESLQQCQENTGCSPSGVFLTASALGSGEKIPEEIGHSGFFDSDFPVQVPPAIKSVEAKSRSKHKLKSRSEDGSQQFSSLREHLSAELPDVMLASDEFSKDEANSSDDSAGDFDVHGMMPHNYFDQCKGHDDSSRGGDDCSLRSKKSRKSKKSLAREKLEQTFKEKGFLIQTQQLESAEGATYCKFRQLRKFTRYLFRSWKDYLPGNVRDLSVDAGVEANKLPDLPDTGIKTEPCDLQGKNI